MFTVDMCIEILERTPGVIRTFLDGLSDNWIKGGNRENWNPFDVVGHFIHAKTYYHRIGNDPSEDQIVFTPLDKTYTAFPMMYEDKHLFIYSSNSTIPENILVYRQEGNDEFQHIIPELNGNSYILL